MSWDKVVFPPSFTAHCDTSPISIFPALGIQSTCSKLMSVKHSEDRARDIFLVLGPFAQTHACDPRELEENVGTCVRKATGSQTMWAPVLNSRQMPVHKMGPPGPVDVGKQGRGPGYAEEGWQPFTAACHREGWLQGKWGCVSGGECDFPGGSCLCRGAGKLLGETSVYVCTRVEVMCVY